jgi:cytochrome c-type biogenesis protein CcmF
MNVTIGSAGVTLGFAAAVLGVITLVAGVRSGRRDILRTGSQFVWLVLAGAIVAVFAMQRGLITRDFSMAYVAQHGSTLTPRLFNVAAMWSALEGSILLWALVLAGYVVAVWIKFRKRLDDPLVAWALITLMVICVFFFALMIGPANPFTSVAGTPPVDGRGPNPLLQNHILMAFHPPLLYLGYVGFSVPYAFATAALVTGRIGEGWLLATRRWSLYAWGFLTLGIVLGSWWAYEVTNWGGFWGWDAVENASFLPWLTGTAFLHSVLVQERRGMLRVWNLSLVSATFALTILGTFLTRSGVIGSVHAFSESDLGPWLLSFFAVIVAITVGLIGWRGDRLRSPGAIDSPVSREGAFLLNNVLFAGFAFVILLGTVFPLVVEAINDDKISVGRPFFDQVTRPIGLVLLFLMAVAPVLPWRAASAELLRQRLIVPVWCGAGALVLVVALGLHGWGTLLAWFLGGVAMGSAGRQLVLATRRQKWRGLVGRANGGMIVHIGVIVIAVAIATRGSSGQSGVFTLNPGETAKLAGHTFTYNEFITVQESQRVDGKALISIDGGQVYAPAVQRYTRGDIIAVPSVKSTVLRDLYLSLEKTPTNGLNGPIRLKVSVLPLTMWLWIGGGLLLVGTVLSAFPGKRRRPTDPTSAAIGATTVRDVASTSRVPADDTTADEGQVVSVV